ncbi:hypothetical protein AB6B39_01525 [Algimonas porphyrae]|nr:hypothetical protein [Algimonas porphyrae]
MMGSPLAIDWAAVLGVATLICTIIGGMLTLVYRLIVVNQGKTAALFDARVEAAVQAFEAALRARDELERERIDGYKQDVAALRKRQDLLERELRSMVKDLSRNYVPREDFLKRDTALELKLDRLGERLVNIVTREG